MSMSGGDIGLTAPGLCLHPLLQHGIPSSSVIGSIIAEIDDTLTHNNRQLEECVKDIMDLSAELTGDPNPDTPMQALERLLESKILDKAICYDPDTQQIKKMLQSIKDDLSKPHCEESVLQRLLELSSIQGLSLPVPSMSAGHHENFSSNRSLGAVLDQDEESNSQLWLSICAKLRQYFVERLYKLPVGAALSEINISEGRRLTYIQSLCILYPVQEVWNKYFSIRSQQLEHIFPNSAPPLAVAAAAANKRKDSQLDGSTLCPLVVQLEVMAKRMLNMIREDFELLVTGVFSEVIPMFKAIQELYLDRLSEELASITLTLQSALLSTLKSLPKSSSESQFRPPQFNRPSLSKQLSFSLDNLGGVMPMASSTSEAAIQPQSQLEALVRLVNCVLGIDAYVETLHRATRWEASGSKSKPPTKPKSLKSVLKATTPDPKPDSKHPPLERRNSKPFSPRSFETSGLTPESIPAPFDAEGTPGATSPVVESVHEGRLHWDWQRPFRKLISDISSVVDAHIKLTTKECQQSLSDSISKRHCIDTTDLPAALSGGRLDYAKTVSSAVWCAISEMDWLLPLAAAGNRGPFEIVRSTYVDSITSSLKDISSTLATVSTDVSEKKLAVSCLYTSLSTAACIRNHLLHFDSVLGAEEASRKRFSTPYRHYCELVDTLARQTIEYHTQLLVSSLLNDAESHDWTSSKEFYEDERCSFGVQMWHTHMCGVQADLWKWCPPKLAQSILTAIVHDTLMAFVQRYSKAKPSYKRTRQFRRDITFILLVTSEILYSVSGSLIRYVDVSLAHQASYSIHTLASCLLATMIVVTAPIDALYKAFKKGFAGRRSSRRGESEVVKGHPCAWLSWLRPSLFKVAVFSYDQMQTTTALYVQLKLMDAQPETSWPMLLQVLLMKDYTLSIMLLSRVVSRLSTHTDDDAAQSALMLAVTDVFASFVDILTKCSDFPAALFHVLCPVFDRTNSWEIFDDKAILGKTHPCPPWMQAILSTLTSFVVRVIDPAVRVLLVAEEGHVKINRLFANNTDELPCGCEVNTADVETEKPECNILEEALYSLITQMVEDIYCLATPLCCLFLSLQKQADKREIETPHSCLGLKIVVSAVRLALNDIDRIQRLIGQTVSESCQEKLKMLAECVYHVLMSTTFGKGSGTPRIAATFMKTNRNWLLEQIEILTDHLNNDIFILSEEPPFKDDPQEFIENQLVTTASAILHTDSGLVSLEKVHNFTMNNIPWILAQLDIPPLIGGVRSPSASPEFSLCMSPVQKEDYNPLQAYNHIDSAHVDQETLADWPYVWSAMLGADLGLTEVTFSRLLYQRHEMQEGAYLEEREMKPVQALRAKFEMEPVDI